MKWMLQQHQQILEDFKLLGKIGQTQQLCGHIILIYVRAESEFSMFLKWQTVIYQILQFGMLRIFWENKTPTLKDCLWCRVSCTQWIAHNSGGIKSIAAHSPIDFYLGTLIPVKFIISWLAFAIKDLLEKDVILLIFSSSKLSNGKLN